MFSSMQRGACGSVQACAVTVVHSASLKTHLESRNCELMPRHAAADERATCHSVHRTREAPVKSAADARPACNNAWIKLPGIADTAIFHAILVLEQYGDAEIAVLCAKLIPV